MESSQSTAIEIDIWEGGWGILTKTTVRFLDPDARVSRLIRRLHTVDRRCFTAAFDVSRAIDSPGYYFARFRTRSLERKKQRLEHKLRTATLRVLEDEKTPVAAKSSTSEPFQPLSDGYERRRVRERLERSCGVRFFALPGRTAARSCPPVLWTLAS